MSFKLLIHEKSADNFAKYLLVCIGLSVAQFLIAFLFGALNMAWVNKLLYFPAFSTVRSLSLSTDATFWILCGNFLIYSAILLFVLKNKYGLFNFVSKYVPCPLCDKSVNVYTQWRCDLCHNTQKKEKYITENCDHCERRLKSVFCEHCHGEIAL